MRVGNRRSCRSGNPGCDEGYCPPWYGTQVGEAGSKHPKLLEQTVWIAGSEAEVGWAVAANHGGGYSYRLCPAGQELTEKCFQSTPLDFVGNTQWIQFDAYDPETRAAITAHTVSEGTTPAGSQWRKNPIPAQKNAITGFGGYSDGGAEQFEPQIPGFYGLGQGNCFGLAAAGNASAVAACVDVQAEHGLRISQAGIIDKVRVPDVPPGDYVLSFRWDCEATPQVWNSCADIKIKSVGTPSKPFTPMSGCEPCCAETLGYCANCTACREDKSGACAYCWEEISPRIAAGLVGSDYLMSCLGNEDPATGKAPTSWPAGTASRRWSPGCGGCWDDESSCTPREREVGTILI